MESGATVAGGGDGDDPAATVPVAGDALRVEGAAPTDHPAGVEPSVAAWVFRAGAIPRSVGLTELPQLVGVDANIIWLDLAGYAEPDLRAVADHLGLHPGAVGTALGPWHRPRLDVFGEQFLVSATVPALEDTSGQPLVRAGQLFLFARRNAVVSAHKEPLPFADRALARARQSSDLPRLDAAYLLYVLLDELLDHAERLAEAQEDQVAAMEERALVDAGRDFLGELLGLKRSVVALGRLVDQHREVVAAFGRPEFRAMVGDGAQSYFRDLEGRLAHLTGRMAAAKEATDGAFDIYVSRVTYRTNEVMRLLTVVSTVLLPTSVILAFFGTGFEGIPLYSAAAFGAMVVIIAVVTGVILLAFRRRGWFDSDPR